MSLNDHDVHQPLVITLPSRSSPADLEPQLNNIDPERLRSSTSVVFRVDGSLYKALKSENSADILISLASRLTAKPIFLLHYSKREKSHRLTAIRHGHLEDGHQPELIAAARQQDLLAVVEENQEFCYLKATKRHHFISPSGRHCSIFLRVGDTIRSVDALDRLAFWLLPEVAAADAILVDSWTICSVVLRCLHLLNSRTPFDCIGAHPRFEGSMAAAAIDRLILPLPPNPKVSCIISVTSSGSFIDFVQRTVQAVNRPLDLNIVSTYVFAGVTAASSAALCQLPDSVENFASADDCTMCQGEESVAIQVDPRLYYFRDRIESEKPLTPGHFSASAQSYVNLSDISGALRVHRDDSSGGSTKHHAFNVDVSSILAAPAYESRCAEIFASLSPRPSLVVAPDHEAGRLIARIAVRALGAGSIIHNTLRPDLGLPTSDAAKLRQSESILVVDDVLNTGKRMRDYNRALRDQFAHLNSVAYFTVVARTASADELRTTENALRVGHKWNSTVTYIERIFLPRWGAELCPWCREFQFLSLVSERMARPPSWLFERVSRLSELERGVIEEPLFLLPDVLTRGAGRAVEDRSRGHEFDDGPFLIRLCLTADENRSRPGGAAFPACYVRQCVRLTKLNPQLRRRATSGHDAKACEAQRVGRGKARLLAGGVQEVRGGC
jgi:hypothetical protein